MEKGLFVRAYCIQTMQPSFNFNRRGKTARPSRARGSYDPSISGEMLAREQPTCRFTVGVSFPRAVPAGALVICIQSCVYIYMYTCKRARKATVDERDNCERDGKLLS